MSSNDDSMTQSQFDMILPPNQERLTKIRVKKFTNVRKEFNDKLIIDNNLKDCDEGVNEGLMALDDASYKAVSKLLKPKVIATLGFLKGVGFIESKQMYNKAYVEDLRKELVMTYEQLGRQHCNQCDKVFDGNSKEETVCFICDKAMCLKCLPMDSDREYPKGLIPACGQCQEEVKHNNKRCSNDKKKHESPEVLEVLGRKDSPPNSQETRKDKVDYKETPEDKNGKISKDNTKDKKDDVCIHYIFKSCRHGRQGKECK